MLKFTATKRRPYRGRHPNRINAVSSRGREGMIVITNNGDRYLVKPSGQAPDNVPVPRLDGTIDEYIRHSGYSVTRHHAS